MKKIFILRGLPGSGKSTFVSNNKLEPYTISPDDLRLQLQSPELGIDGRLTISQKYNLKVWAKVYELVEAKMGRGELIIVDATHTDKNSLKTYQLLSRKYNYEVFVVDFTDIDTETAKKRNQLRQEYKQVPEQVIERMQAKLTNFVPSPKNFTVIKPEEFSKVIEYQILDFNKYIKIHHIGDLQGCFWPLNKYFDQFQVKEDELYIFVGDYIDRGKENDLVIEFVLQQFRKPNFIFIEGNHESYLRSWAVGESVRTNEFNLRTKPQLEKANLDKKDILAFCNKLQTGLIYKFQEKTVLVTHAGLSTLPTNLNFISDYNMIRGSGIYADIMPVADKFVETTRANIYQVYGHRNKQEFDIRQNQRCFNLEGKVEFGGSLRILTLDKHGFETIQIKNQPLNLPEASDRVFTENREFVHNLGSTKYIKEKKYENNISSFNFTTKAFFNKVWTKMTTQARGLFINTQTLEIVIRSYNKFFNLNERRETEILNLKETLQFPLKAWLKENGYLGLIGYNSQFDKLVFASKTSIDSDFASWLEDIIYNQKTDIEYLKQYLKDKNACAVFEVIQTQHDPHLIEYPETKVVLLDLIKRQPIFEPLAQNERESFAKKLNFETKQLAYELSSFVEFETWIERVTKPNYQYQGKCIEGFVLEDARGFMFKTKLYYYTFWKQMRNMIERFTKSGEIKDFNKYLDSIKAEKFYNYIKNLDRNYLEKTSIIDLRKQFGE